MTMEHLFSPCNGWRDRFESQGLRPPEGLQELILDVSTEELLSAERGFTYEDLYAMLGNGDTIAWLTPHAAVAKGGLFNESCRYHFNVDGKEIFAWAHSPEHVLEICDVVLRLLAASVVYSVTLYKMNSRDGAMISSVSLAYMMEQCQSLKVLTLLCLEMDENHCRVLGDYSRPGLEIELKVCKLTSAGASALADVLGRNQGPTMLHYCDIDYSVLANGLRGNSRLEIIEQDFSGDSFFCNQQVLAIAVAVRENEGLVELILKCYGGIVNEETWGAVFDSLKTHPTLEVLKFVAPSDHRGPMAPDVITSRTQALVDMMKMNTTIEILHVDSHYSEHETYRESVIPYLKTNRLRSRLPAIQRTLPMAYRAKVLGRALLAVRSDPNRFWMLLSGNAEVVFLSMTATTTAATNLPTSATASAIAATGGATAVATSVMSALTTTVTGSLPTATATAPAATSTTTPFDAAADVAAAAAAADVAAPTTRQKRKARPR
jgi:hypothetical protein